MSSLSAMLETARTSSTTPVENDADRTATPKSPTRCPTSNLSETSNLCDECAYIDGQLSRLERGEPIRYFGRFKILASTTCDSCLFFSRCLSFQAPNREYFLLAADNDRISKLAPIFRCIRSPLLWLAPHFDFDYDINGLRHAAVVMVKETLKSHLYCRPIAPLIDFEAARTWYDICSYTHSHHCTTEPRGSTSLTVIDVQKRQLTPCPPDSPYVTLSYVWGASAQDLHGEVSGSRLPQPLPGTIEDSLEVTSRMGFRYLWVDKYCVDKTDLHYQLKIMATIYRNSAITIVAASGKDSSSGLPGVSRPRNQPQRISFGQNSLIPVPFIPIREIESSTWNSRAWTFQEGLLATRRLVFCENQVYFECQSSYCLEGIAPPVDILLELRETENFEAHHRGVTISGKNSEREFGNALRPAKTLGVFPLNGCGDRFIDVFDRIGEYSTKSLSYPTDILNAMLGIFELFNERFGMKHLWGVPYLGLEAQFWGDCPAVSQLFAANLEWPSNVPRARREGFPSWSWVGWFGNFHAMQCSNWRSALHYNSKMPKPLENNIHWVANHSVMVQVETNYGEVLDLATFEKLSATSTSSVASRFIHVSTFTNSLKPIWAFVDPDTPACHFDIVEFSSVSGANWASPTNIVNVVNFINFRLSLDYNIEEHIFNEALVSGKLLALHIPQPNLRGFRKVLVVQEMTDCWERVATAEFHDPNGDFDVVAKPTWKTIRLG